MAQVKQAASEKGGNAQNDPPVTTPDQSQGHPKAANKYESKGNTENINIDMTIGELLGVTKCEAYATQFNIFKLAGDITQYSKEKFQKFLKTKCEIDEFSAQFVELGKAYDKLKIQQNQSNCM